MAKGEEHMSLISKETLLMHLQRAEMASDVNLPIEFFRDLIYQAMPRPWVGLTRNELLELANTFYTGGFTEREIAFARVIEAKLKEKNNG